MNYPWQRHLICVSYSDLGANRRLHLSIQGNEPCQKWDAIFSVILPSEIVLSKWYQFFDFTLISLMTASIKWLLSASFSKVISGFFWKRMKFILVPTGWPTIEGNKVTLIITYHHFKIHVFLQKTDIDDSRRQRCFVVYSNASTFVIWWMIRTN